MVRFKFRYVIGLAASLVLCAGCSSRDSTPQVQTVTQNGIVAKMAPEPDPFNPPGFLTHGSVHGVPDVGTNDLMISLTDEKTNTPIVDASLTVTASTQLTGGTGDTQTGKSNGDGTYHVDKLNLPLSETYAVTVLVDQPGKPERKLSFTLTPQ